MKILKSLQELYNSKEAYYSILKAKVEELLLPKKKNTWHYTSRIKSIESFALKMETGRFDSNSIFEDYFACTLVVENIDEINNASNLVNSLFSVIKQKPHNQHFTHKRSDCFEFDDLRIYCKLKQDDLKPLSNELLSLTFEVQIKTFLQHAWSIATHDLIYKSDKINWGKERVAYQVKASLEHAEVSISSVEKLSEGQELSKETKEIKQINNILKFIYKHFNKEDLPNDKRRLAQNILLLLDLIEVKIKDLDNFLSADTSSGSGTKLRNLSPYMIILQSIYNQNPSSIEDFLHNEDNKKGKVLITPELSIKRFERLVNENVIDLR